VGLPTEDLTESHLEHFFYMGGADAPHAVVGIELCAGFALLRSLAVEPMHRGEGLAAALLAKAEAHAKARGAELMFLLTTTAEEFFKRRGYVPADRLTAPAPIRATREFVDLCPASSTFMLRKL
jgi:amino-acid N-acetyltransferase